jgi:hypothetical protein
MGQTLSPRLSPMPRTFLPTLGHGVLAEMDRPPDKIGGKPRSPPYCPIIPCRCQKPEVHSGLELPPSPEFFRRWTSARALAAPSPAMASLLVYPLCEGEASSSVSGDSTVFTNNNRQVPTSSPGIRARVRSTYPSEKGHIPKLYICI